MLVLVPVFICVIVAASSAILVSGVEVAKAVCSSTVLARFCAVCRFAGLLFMFAVVGATGVPLSLCLKLRNS